ncbi:protein-disulfide reductase DsbD domain-containing protein [Pseudoxanthomonas sp. SGT-18]|uniref:protein-disulfide reductase DsbD family protein n=1 Tax=Pseudoxanthomonas sp. SGT-18 TaxID=2493087 RepID=UPI001F0C3710|nr:protein-disulfide reductase DsbD domain-containing protein [Pseudoxanthomonas sp. SGT-18]
MSAVAMPRTLRARWPLLGALLAGAVVPSLHAKDTGPPGLLPVEQAFALDARLQSPTRLRLHWRVADDYYLYRERIHVRALDDAPAPELRLPPGVAKDDPYLGPVEVYRGEASAEVVLAAPAAPATATRLRVVVQGCHEVEPLVCYPPHATVLRIDGGLVRVEGAPDAGATATVAVDAGVAGATGSGTAAAAATGAPAVAALLLSAVLGGLLLNLMPCVLPVLSLKVLSLAGSGGSPRHARRRALAYTAGVLLAFAALGAIVLALRGAGLAVGWGFQLQQPVVVAFLAWVMLALGLSLSGVVLIGTRLGGAGQALAGRDELGGDFSTGVLAVVVASPCTAPFMGVALAAAFALPVAAALGVFLALGLGLALPFLLAGFVPALATRLPRPGPWMETLKQALAFPLYATSAWLAWVLVRQHGSEALGWLLAGMLWLALALWASERLRHVGNGGPRLAALLLALVAAWPLYRIHALPTAAPEPARQAADGSLPYSAQALARLRADGRTVFVNMTADWCVTCKANERRVFARAPFRTALHRSGAVYLKGDWTRMDPEITAFLREHGAVGVPLYVVFRPGGAGRVLSTVPTEAQVEAALQGDAS